MKKRVLHLGAWGRNWGDRVIQWSMAHYFCRPHVDLVQVDIQSQRFVGEEDAERVNDGYDLIVVGGGGLLWEKPELDSPSGWQWQYDHEFMKHLDVPVVLWALGEPTFPCQPPIKLETYKNVCEVVDRSVFSSGRTTATCKKFGLETFVFDPGYVTRALLEGYQATDATQKYALPLPNHQRDFLVCWGSDKAGWRSDKFPEDEAWARELQRILNAGWVRHVPEVDTDIGRFPFLPDPALPLVPKLLRVYQRARAVWSNRKHGLLIPLGLGVPAFSVKGSAQEVKDIEREYPIVTEHDYMNLHLDYQSLVERVLK